MFDAGAIQAHLDVEMAVFDRKLTEAEERVKRFEEAKHEVKITAKLDSSSINEARQAFARLDQQITRDAVQRSRTSPQGSVLGSLAAMTGGKTIGGKAAAGLGKAPLLLSAGLALTPALAALGGVGLGAGIAGGGALAAAAPAAGAFAAIAKPVLTQALAAEQAVKKAQDAYNLALASGANRAKAYAAEQQAIAKAYTGMSPAQKALSEQLGQMAANWDKVKQKETPVVAGALQPWLKSVSDMMTKLNPIIVAVSGVVGSLGKGFDVLVNSPAFTGFRNFVAGTGSLVIGTGGRSVLDIMHGLMVLLPQFAPLIDAAARGVGHMADKFEAWAISDKARTDVSNFLKWFKENGPTVGRFLTSIGTAVAALAPGLSHGGIVELQALTWFLNMVSKLPPGVSGPLLEIAGAALVLAKLPGGGKVISFAINLVGQGAAAILNLLGLKGKASTLNVASGGMQTAADTMLAASKNNLRAAGMQETAAGEEEAAAGGMAGGGGGLLAKGKGLLGKGVGAAGLGAAAYFGGQAIVGATTKPGTTGAKWGQVGVDTATGAAAGAMFGPIGAGIGAAIGLAVGLATQFHHQIAHIWDDIRHETANIFDGMRHETMHIFDDMFGYTIGVAIRFGHNIETQYDSITHEIAVIWDGMRHEVAQIWDMVWNNTIGRAERGAHDVAVMFDNMRHSTAAKFDGIRHDIAHAWDVVYNNTIGALIRLGSGIGDRFTAVKNWIWQHFVTDVSNWFTKTLPNTFASAVTLIGNAWDFIRGKISGPIRTVANATIVPLFKGIDTITNFVLGKNPLAGAIKTLQGLASGGRIHGGTHETADDVLIRVSRNETVLSAAHSRILAPALAALGVPGYQQGGGVGRGANIPSTFYTNPVGAGAVGSRIDMGVDYTGSFPLYALGSGRILNLYNSGWPGGTFMSLQLDQGPHAGQIWYYAEHIVPDMLVGPGIHVNRGQKIGFAPGGSPWTELGWAANGTGTTMAVASGQQRRGQAQGDPGRYATQWGVDANNLIVQLGGPSGTVPPGGISGGGPGALQRIFGAVIRTLADIFSPLGNMAKVAIDLAHGDTGAAGRAMTALFPATKGGAFGGLADLMLGLPPKMIADTMKFLVSKVKSFATSQQSTSGPTGPLPAAAGPLIAYAKKLLASYGWASQFPAFNNLEMHEAGYNANAKNPTSTAYGIGQFLDSTWATVGGTKTSNPYTQLQLMMKYIGQRYGSPNAAWAQYFQHAGGQGSYADGGPINEPVIGFGTVSGQRYTFGENGREWVSPAGPGGGPQSGAMIGNVHIQLPEGQTVARALNEITFWLNVARQQGYVGVLPGG